MKRLNLIPRILFALMTMSMLLYYNARAQAVGENADTQLAAWQAVKSGQAVVLMRHALAPGTGDPGVFELGDCSTQRNLSDQGRQQAAAIGDVLRSRGISNATVLSSEWCRCVDTASLLGFGDPKPTPMINSFFRDRSTAEQQTAELRESLAAWIQQSNDVKILVTHQVNISALTDQYASSGDMLIVTLAEGKPVVLEQMATR